jgi:hypothetical protein
MDGERRFVTVMIGVGMICLTMLYVFLFVSLWAYRQWVGASLLAVLVALAVVYMRGRLNEQQLRRVRYRHHEEIPLDVCGEPYYWPQDAQENPNHVTLPVAQPHAASQYEGGYERGW